MAYNNIKAIHLISLERKLCFCILEGHDDAISSVVFSHDSKILATGSCDMTAIIWDITTGRILNKLVGHSNSISSVAFSPNS